MTAPSSSHKPLRTVLLGAVALALGMQWAALQIVAWTTMTISNASTMPLGKALELAMSDDQSCVLCQFIRENKDSETNRDYLLPATQSEVEGVMAKRRSLLPALDGLSCGLAEAFLIQFGDDSSPPSPPPRLAV